MFRRPSLSKVFDRPIYVSPPGSDAISEACARVQDRLVLAWRNLADAPSETELAGAVPGAPSRRFLGPSSESGGPEPRS